MLDVAGAMNELAGAWKLYQQSTIRRFNDGLALGRACCKWRDEYRAQGSRHGTGFEALLRTIGIPKTTAYRWIKRYQMRARLRSARHEVHQGTSARTICFRFELTVEEKAHFEEDVAVLGGQVRAVRLFLEFVAKAASDLRTCPPKSMTSAA